MWCCGTTGKPAVSSGISGLSLGEHKGLASELIINPHSSLNTSVQMEHSLCHAITHTLQLLELGSFSTLLMSELL